MLIGRADVPRHRVTVRLLFEPRDVWVGVFWNRAIEKVPDGSDGVGRRTFRFDRFLLVYVTLVPCLPVCVAIRRCP
jgi:hypothetical protein